MRRAGSWRVPDHDETLGALHAMLHHVRSIGTSRVAAVNGLSRAWASRIGDEDVACSGLGTWVVLALLADGSAGAARAELERAIGVPADTAVAAPKEVVAWLASLRRIRLAAGVWTRAAVPLEAGWRD